MASVSSITSLSGLPMVDFYAVVTNFLSHITRRASEAQGQSGRNSGHGSASR